MEDFLQWFDIGSGSLARSGNPRIESSMHRCEGEEQSYGRFRINRTISWGGVGRCNRLNRRDHTMVRGL